MLVILLTALASAGSTSVGPWTASWTDDVITVSDGTETSLELVDHSADNAQESYDVISVVGPWISVEYSWYAEGGAHPSYGTVWRVHDMTRAGQRVKLTDLWDDEVLLKALLADSVIARSRRGDGTPKTVDDLVASLDGGCEMDLSARMLESWAIHSVKGDKVAVRIGLTHGCEVNRGAFTQLGVWLPIPTGMKAAVAQADARGTLYEDLAKPKKK